MFEHPFLDELHKVLLESNKFGDGRTHEGKQNLELAVRALAREFANRMMKVVFPETPKTSEGMAHVPEVPVPTVPVTPPVVNPPEAPKPPEPPQTPTPPSPPSPPQP